MSCSVEEDLRVTMFDITKRVVFFKFFRSETEMVRQ